MHSQPILLLLAISTAKALSVASVRSRIPMPLASYESVVRRIHTARYYPCMWFDIDNATDFRHDVDYCSVRYDCRVRDPPPRLLMKDIGSMRMFTGRRDTCKMLFINKTGNPLMLVSLLVRPLVTGGCCIDFESRLMEDPEVGGLLACALVMAMRKNAVESLSLSVPLRPSVDGQLYKEHALQLPKSEYGAEPVVKAADYFEWHYR